MSEEGVYESMPSEFLVAVMVRHRPAPPKPWLRDSWQVIGVVVSSRVESGPGGKGTLIRSSPEGDDYLWSGLTVRLYKDELESYYHNLISERPSIYVISSVTEEGCLQPFRVSACFDEANAYNEAGQHIESLPMPPELYQWVESYVLNNYVPEPRIKRKRRDWKEDDHERS